MKSISETDGLDRERRLAEASRTVPLRVLEDEFPALLSRAMRLAAGVEVRTSGHAAPADFATLYQYQPLVALSTIESLDVHSLEETFQRLSGKEARTLDKDGIISEKDAASAFINSLVFRLEEARKRLEYACMATAPLLLLQDLRLQLDLLKRTNASEKELFPVLTAIRELQKKSGSYREEILSSGQMDPSLAVLAAFLSNYAEVAGRFNRRWQELPLWYISRMLGESHRPESPGTAWLTYTGDENTLTGYRLLTPLKTTAIKLEQTDLLWVERRRERYPEAALGYITSLRQIALQPTLYQQAPVGFILRSSVFQLSGGERDVTIACTLTPGSLICLDTLIEALVRHDDISASEALYKVLDGSFTLSVTTAQGWQDVEHFTLRLHRENRQLRFRFLLDSDFPSMCGEGNFQPAHSKTESNLPAVRFLIQPSAWLYPYSWCKQMRLESVSADVSVEGLHEGVFYNELGPIDPHQPFVPFGVQNERGSWVAFGHYEMACKRVTQVRLDFRWLQVPRTAGGLYAYYKGYRQSIDNRSFRARTEFLQNGQWKPTPGEEIHYLFRTVDSDRTKDDTSIPQTDGVLSEQSSVTFVTPVLSPLSLPSSDSFRPGLVPSGFYRLVLGSPEMGFGDKEYRRLFADVMLHNAHRRHKISTPEEPLSPRWDAPVLSYTAHEERSFVIGGGSALQLDYITPFSIQGAPDVTAPVPFVQGPDDEAIYLFTLSGAEGENLFFMYVEMEPLQQEIDHDNLPQMSWFYNDGTQWRKIPPSNLLRDETGGWMHSGVVEIQLPLPISQEMLDEDGLFRMYASIHCHSANCAALRRLHFNIVQAEAVSDTLPLEQHPQLTGYRLVSPLTGKVSCENDVELQLRVSERTAHRNRALLPQDYERMVLQQFPEVRKVKCLPGIDAKYRERQALVTLALIGSTPGMQQSRRPLCEDRLLCSVEHYLRSCTPPFVEVDAINPVYEEVTVFCGIVPAAGQTTGGVIAALQQLIHGFIAPWYEEGGTPVFGHSFSLPGLQDAIREHPSVSALHGIKIVHLVSGVDGGYVLNEYLSGDAGSSSSEASGDATIRPSCFWGILVPAARTHIILCTADEWRGKVEFGDLELEQTFVIA